MQDNSTTLSWVLAVNGSEQSAANVARVGDSFASLDAKTKETVSRFTGVASASSALGTALARVSPQMGGLIQSFGAAGAAASGLRAAIGGLGGLVGGGLVAVISLATKYFYDEEQAAEAASKALRDQEKAVNGLTMSYKELQASRERASRAALGVESAEDLIYKYDKMQDSLKASETVLDNMIHRSGEYADVESDRLVKLAYLKNQEIISQKAALVAQDRLIRIEQERSSNAIVSMDTMKEREDSERRSISAVNSEREKGLRLMDEKKRRSDEEWARLGAGQQGGSEIIPETEIWKDKVDKPIQYGMDRETEYNNYRMAQAEAFIQKSEAAEKEHQAKMGAISTQYMNVAGHAVTGALSDIVKGRDVAVEKILEGIGDQMVATGTQHLMEGIAMQFIPFMQPFASGLMTAGAAEIATGLTFGAIGARAGASKGGGGGGATSPASPTTSTRAIEKEKEPAPVVIHVNTLRADDEAGKAIYTSLQKYQNKHGKSASLNRMAR